MRRLEKGWAVIVGGSAGMGLAFAKECAAHGHHVLLIARGAERLRMAAAEVVAGTGARVETAVIDANVAEQRDTLRKMIEAQGIRPAIVFIGIGHWVQGPILDATTSEIRSEQEVGIVTPLALLSALVPTVAPGGRILVIGSLAGFLPMPGIGIYAAAKAQLNSMVLSLRQELRPRGICVSLLAPSVVATEFIPPADNVWRKIVENLSSAPETIGRGAYRGLMSGEPVIVPGILGKIGFFGTQVVPAAWLAWFMGIALKPLLTAAARGQPASAP